MLPDISRKGAPNIKGLGKLCYVVEQTFALLHQLRRLCVRRESRTELHDGLRLVGLRPHLPATHREETTLIVLRDPVG